MGRFKLSRWSSVDTNHDCVMKSNRKQKEMGMMMTEENRVKTLNGRGSDNLSKAKGDDLVGTNLLRNRNSVSARVRLNHGPLSKMLSSPFSSSYVLLLLLTFAYIACVFADPLSQDPNVKCNDSQFRCDCGVPRCIDKSLVKNGEKDCQDGSDEGQWDPSKCAIKNTTSEDIRFRRAALPENPSSRVISSGDATTQFFTGDRARTRPVGLLSTNLGAFVTSGTTTEYLTKILGTYIKGTYARITSTSSKVYHAVPTDAPDFATGAVRPTGFIASTVSTEVNGYATTLHTTDFYRTYIDGTYAQLVSSYSNVQYPAWFTEQIDPTAAPDASSSHIYATKASDFHVSVSSATHQILPQEVRGSFVKNGMQSKAVAEVGVVVSSSSSSSSKERDSNRLRALKPLSNSETELRVTGTHGKFVHTGSGPGDETTYNVFTGSYVQNSKTFLFFFGNTVIDPSQSGENPQQTIMVENGTSSNVLVDMTKNLRVIVPSKNNRMMVDGSVNGEHMDGVIVEIEGSEPSIEEQDEGITVGGAVPKSTPSDPRIDMMTVNLNKKKPASRVSTSSSSSSSVSNKHDNDNEIPRARKVQDDGKSVANLIRPSRTRTVSLPTFTVGQPDVEDSPMDADFATSTAASNKVVVNVESSSRARPVFQKPTTEKIQKTTERVQSYSRNSQNSYTPTYKNSKQPNRNHRAFSGFDVMAAKFNDIDSDLQSAASTGRATVTYVGFADFTTTVGNTVIVFMPRTKMIEDLSVHATATRVDMQSPRVEPTRFVYHTEDEEETTTQRRPYNDDDEEFGRGKPKGRKVGMSASVSVSSSTTPRDEEDDSETTTEISPSEAVREVSGRQTLILGNKRFSSSSSSGSRFSSEFKPIATPALRPSLVSKFRPSLSSHASSASSSSTLNDRRNSLFSNSNRPRYTPKLSKTSEAVVSSSPVITKPTSQSGVYQVASTAVFQTDKVNPTGLVTSIDGTLIRDKTTYLFTSLVYGTYIGSSYAQIIKSTSRVLPIKATASAGPTVIRPTPIARFPRPSKGFYNEEITTEIPTTAEPDEEGETTIRPMDRMEVSVSSTTERAQSKEEDNEVPTTTSKTTTEEDDSYYEDYTTTTERDLERENEIERKRKVAGQAKDQIIVDKDDTLEATPTTSLDEDQTIYVTRTQPTTVYRTYTYYTTYFIPKEDSTLTSVTSREVTSTSVGLARKTYTSIQPTSTEDSAAEVTETVSEKEKSRGSKFRPSSSSTKGKVRPSGAQVIYKTFYTTFTYLTTFFTGQTSSVKSREEVVSNVVTTTSSIGSTSTTSVKIRPTASAALRSKSYKTVAPRLSSSLKQGGPSDNIGATSPGLARFSSIRRPKVSSKIVSVPPSPTFELKSVGKGASKVMEPVTVLKTFYTTYTYFTTLFNGDETSIKSRTDVVTNVVPTVTRTAIVPSATASLTENSDEYAEEEYEDDTEAPETQDKDKYATSTAFRMSNKNKQKETTFYTTYTYLTTSLGQDGGSQIRSSLKTFTNVLVGDKTIRSGMVGAIEPTKLTGRSAGKGAKKTARPFAKEDEDDDDDLNEVGSHVSETSETTLRDDDDDEAATTVDPHQNDYYELEGSETPITTDRSIFDEELGRKKHKNNQKNKNDDDDDDENGLDATPVLKTYFTTFTYYTTFYQDGTSTVSSNLETKTQVVTDTAIGDEDDTEPTVTVKEALLSTSVEPVTYYTTYTYWTTSSIDGSTIINSRKVTSINVVTPGVDDVAPTEKALKASENEIVPTASSEVELITYFTTFTYFTTSYIGDSTVVNSHLETETNVVTRTADSDSPVSSVVPTKPSARAIGTSAPGVQQVGSGDKDEYQDYDLSTGLLSTIVSSEVVDRTTTIYSTDVFGTYIDGIYAQVLESTSKVINPTASAETRFLPEATETVTGVVSVNEGKTVDADGLATTYYGTTAYGTVIDGTYAHLIESTSNVKKSPDATSEQDATEQQRTGLVRIIDGTNVDGDHTTYYTSSIVGTFIDGQYAQVIESTSRYVINPTRSDGITTVSPTKVVEIESSITERPSEDDDDITTTEKTSEQEEEEEPETVRRTSVLPGRRPSFGKSRVSSRLSYKSSSKTSTPAITPFASRSRPSGFVPRGRKTQSSISPTKTDESTGSTPTSSRGGFQSRRKFQRPGESSSSTSDAISPTTATPRLPFSRGGSRFQRPSNSGSRFATTKAEIQPTSASTTGTSSPGGRGRSNYHPRGGSSAAGARGRVSSSGFTRPSGSSTGGYRGGSSSSRFLPGRGRSTAAINPSSTTSATTVKPTQTSNHDEEEYEVEYEYESSHPPSSTTTTTESPRSNSNRFGSNNRFRLNPRLSTPVSTSGTTSRPSTTRNLPFLRRQTFSKPTLPTRGTTPTSAASAETSPTAATTNNDDEYEEIEVEEYEEEEKPSSTTSTTRPSRPGLLGRRPPGSGGLSSLTSRPSSRTPQATTTTTRARSSTEAPQQTRITTTRRTYTPRPRPAGFPKPIGITRSTTTTTEKPDSTLEEYYEDGDFEYEESRHLPGNVTIDQASGGSEVVETVLKPDGEVVEAENVPVSSSHDGSQISSVAASQDSKDTVEALLSYAAGSPYQSIPGQQEADTGIVGGLRRRKRQANSRQVYDYYNSYSPYQYNYNSQQFGARAARGTLRSNFSPSPNARRSGNSFGSSSSSGSSNSNSNTQSNSRGGPTYSTSDYDYVEYYDDQPAPPPTPAAPKKAAPSSRLRGRIQPTPTSARRTPFTLTHSDNSNTNKPSSSTNTRPSSATRSRTSSYNSRTSSARPTTSSSSTNARTFIPRRSPSVSRYSKPTEPPTTTGRSNRFRSRYNPRDSVTTAAPSYSRTRFGSQLTRGRGTSTTSNSLTRFNSNNNNVEPPFEASTITVTHYIPQETTFPIVNGKSTEYKTVLTPSPSVEVLSPYQYTQIDYQGKLVLVKNEEVTSTVGPGATEITQFLIREMPTSTVTFTPTTIRGRKTSFSHILPSTVYSVEPVVSTISNPLGPLLNNPNDPNQLTNLLLNQLLGLNPNLLGLQGQLMANLLNNNNQNNLEPATPITQYSTITTSYTTTVTDYTSTVIPITLHGKAIKTTIVESSTKVISAVEYITSSTVITPSPPPQLIQPTQQQPNAALLQNLLQSQLLQQQLLQQQQQPIVPTQPPQLLLPQVQPTQQVPLLQQLQQLQQKQQLLQQQTQQPQQQEISRDNKPEPEIKNNVNENIMNDEPKIEVTNTPAPPAVEPTKSEGVPAGSSVITVYVSGKKPDEDEGGGGDIIGGSVEVGRGEVIRSFQSLDDVDEERDTIVPEQRVSGGRLFIQNGRDFYTKVMSNGVGVIVRGHKTAHIGFDKTPILPHRVSNRPITLPPHTVSRQFHLIESPGRPLNNAISHLLHSIVRSATPDMVTKTMLTTFTYLTTVLRHSNTIVKSREETISNVMTQKFRPTVEYTPSVKAEPSSLPPDLLASFTGSSSYFINTLTTTYVYLNTFTVDTLPVILTSRETVTNVVTLPIYMSPTIVDLIATGSKVFETETYFTTYTFSKTMLLSDAASEVVTTKEVITQVVVTEALAPPSSQGPLNTPVLPTGQITMDEITKTYFTTFTHLFTEMNDDGQVIIRSSTSISSEVVTEKITAIDSTEIEPDPTLLKIKMTAQPTITGWIEESPAFDKSNHITMRSPSILLSTRSTEFQDPISFTTIQPSITVEMLEPKTLEPIMIYATKTYYTTFTYFTTVLADGTRTKASVQSRTEIISKVVTEALSTSFDAYYLNALKSSYLSKHSTMIDITSSVREVTPSKATLEATERPGTLVTQSFLHPHYPKDNDELAVEVDGTTVNSIVGVEVPADNENPVQAEIQVSSASSEEHFDEVKEEISHIVNVLTDQAQGSEESPTSVLAPSPTQQPIYSTVQIFTPESVLTASETVGVTGVGYVEQVSFDHPGAELHDELHDFAIGFDDSNSVLPVTHIPTPPLEQITTSPMQPLTMKPKTKLPFNPFTTQMDIFPDIGSPPGKSTLVDLPMDVSEYSYEDKDDHLYSSMLMGDRYSTSVLAKRTGTILFDPVTPTFQNPSNQFLNMVSSLADSHWNDYEKEIEVEEEIPSVNIYNIHTTFDSFAMPTRVLVPVQIKSPSVGLKFGSVTRVKMPGYATARVNSTNEGNEDGGDMKIHNILSDDDILLDGSGSGSGENPLYLEEVIETDGSGMGSGYIETETDYREEDHTINPDGGEEVEEGEVEGFTKMTESPVPPFPPKTRYTTSRRPDKRKKTKRPIFGAEITSKEQNSGEGSTKVYSLKVPSLDLGAGQDSVSDESENISEKENDDISSESGEERPMSDSKYPASPGPSKSSITFPVMGPGIHPAPGSGPVASTNNKFDWKPLLKLGAIGLGGLGASSLTKLSPWFNSMAGSLMKGSLLPLARNDSSHSNGNGRPIYHRLPPPQNGDDRDRPHIQHSDPIYIPVGGNGNVGEENSQDDRIPRRPVTSHAKDQNQRPVSLERERERYAPPGRGHNSPYRDIGSDGNFPPQHNYNFQPPNDRLPNIYSLSEHDLHKNGEYTLNDPNLRVINGAPLEVHHHSASDLPVEGKTEFILRPIQNILNGKPAYEGSPRPGPVIPLRPPPPPYRPSGENRPPPPYRSSGENRPPPPYRSSGENRPPPPYRSSGENRHPPQYHSSGENRHPPQYHSSGENRHPPQYHSSGENRHPPRPSGNSRPNSDYGDAVNDIPDMPQHKPVQEIPILRPVPPTEGITVVLPHRIRGDHGGNMRHPTNSELLLNAFKRPFMPKPLHPFRQSNEILNLKPPGPIQSNDHMGGYSGEHSGRPNQHNLPRPPAIHMSPPEMINTYPPHTHPQNHHHQDAEASEENVFKDIFGVRPANQNDNYNNNNGNRKPEISFHPHNAGEGPFRPLASNEKKQSQYHVPVPHPTGIAGQPSNQFGHNEDDISHEDSVENPYRHEFTKMNPTKKPGWPPLDSNSPMSYSYFEDQSHIQQQQPPVQQAENEIASSNLPEMLPDAEMPQPPPLAYSPTPHIPPHRQRPSTVYIIQQEEFEAPTTTTTTTTTTPNPIEQDVGESSLSGGSSTHVTTEYPKLIIKEIPTRPVAPYYRRSTTTSTTPAAANQSPTNRATIAKLFIRRFSTTTTPPSTTALGETTTHNPPRFVTWRTRLRPTYITTTTTTPAPPVSQNNQTLNGGSPETLLDSWLNSPTVNDLQELLHEYKNKYGNSTTTNGTLGPNIVLPQRYSTPSTTKVPQILQDNDDSLGESSEYEDDDELLEDELSVGAASSERNGSTLNHPNHHPVHKEPIDAEHFFSTGQGDFAQYYSGSEDRDTIIDPVNEQIIKSPFDAALDPRRNISALMNRYRSSTARPVFRPVHFRNYTLHSMTNDNPTSVEGLTISLPNDAFSSSTTLDNEITGLPGPTTYRPRWDGTFQSKMGTTSEEPHNPTTFRGDIMRPTTFRPGPDDLPPIGNRLRPDQTQDMVNSNIARPSSESPTTRRPAPQSGIASFYDDEDSMDQLKMKNQEIHKLPTHTKRPNAIVHDILEAISDEEFGSSEKSKLLVAASSIKSSTEKTTAATPNKDNQNKKGDDYDPEKLDDSELYSEEYDSAYEEDAYLEIPPALPTKNNQEYAPAVQSTIKNSAEGKQNNQFVMHGTPPPHHSRRPGPLEMLTNFFRRPQHPRPPPPPNHPMGPGRFPGIPNNSREPTRTMLPPPLEQRPELEYQANAFNPHVKTIPLNPNAEKNSNGGDKVNDPIVLIPKEFTTDNPSAITTTLSPNRESEEKTTLNPAIINFEEGKGKDQATLGSNTVTVNPNSNNNGHRESTYVEDSEYYEDDEMEEDDKNNVIPPEEDNNQQYTGTPIKFQPTPPPPPTSNKPLVASIRPITIGGHLLNNGNVFRPPTANQRRPPQSPPGLNVPGGPVFNNNRPSTIFNSPTLSNLQHVPPLVQNDPSPPKTEMEPPPIDSNRLKAPILELPSSGPIRYRPLNNGYRPNLLRPDDDDFKATTKASSSKTTVHTIATVDDLNKIIATNTFTAIIPTRGMSSSEIQATSATRSSVNIEPSEVHLEGSESSVSISPKSSGTTVRMTSIIKYTGGRLETTEIGGSSTVTRGINIIPTRASSEQSTVTTTTSTNSRLNILNRRPPLIVRQSTTTSTTSTESTSSSTSLSSPKNDNNSTSVRVSVTMESTVSSSSEATADSSAQSINRRPFIPTRAPPTRNTNYPWLRKTTITTSTEKGETSPTTNPTTTSKTISSLEKSYPPRGRQPPTSGPTTEPSSRESGFSTTLRHSPSIFNISRGSSRPDILRRTTLVPARISPPATKPGRISSSSSSRESSRVSMEVSSKVSSASNESKERPSFIFPRPTTSKPPFRRPTLSFVSPSSPTLSKSREKFTTTLINKVSTTSGTPSPTRNPNNIFSGILTTRNFTTPPETSISTAKNASTTSASMLDTEEYEYTDEEYEDEDFELDGVKSDVSERPKVSSATIDTKNTTNDNDGRTVTTSSSMSVSTSMSMGNESRTITVSSSEINPTRVANNDNTNRANRPKGLLNTMVLRGSMSRVPELPAITKYITHSETETKTLTETETTVVVTAGTPYTHTIMITRTLPPQTLISTIVGSVTLVNSIDVKPTTVRSTIFAQPTKEVYSFVDTTEDMESNDDGGHRGHLPSSTIHHGTNGHSNNNKVLHGGVMMGGGRPHNSYKPPTPKPQTPPPNHIPKHETPSTTKVPKTVRNRPTSFDSGLGCPANCTNHGNQACRPYANGTKYKCDCKPGYARLKRKFPCRPTYTYELTLAINHMDGMSFDFKDLQNSATGGYHSFITVSKEAIDKAFLSTDIKRQFQGSEIMKLRPINAQNDKTKSPEPKVYVDFLVQLTANVTEDRIRNHLIRTLKSSNFSVGRTGISSTKNMTDFGARDFNECHYSEFNDCSPNAECLNLRGSYSCRCRAGFRDKSPKKHKPGRDCFEMQGCPECNYKGHCRINAYGEQFCECFRWFGGSKCHINLKILLFAIMGVVAILFIFVLLCSVLVCRRTKIHRERPGSGRFMRYRSPTSQATLDRAAIMNDSASSDGRQSPPRMTMHNHSFTPDSLVVEGDSKQPSSGMRGDSLLGSGPDNVHLMNFSLRNVIMDQDRSLTVVIPRAKIRPPSRPPSIHATLGPDPNADLAATERKLINYLDHSPYPPAQYQSPKQPPPPPAPNSRQSTIKRHDSRQFRKLSLQEQRKISTGALVSSGTEVSARGGMRRRSIGPEPEPTYSGYDKSFSDLRSITDTMRSPAQQHLFSTDTSRTSCYSHTCKPPSYCAYSEQSVGHTMGDKDGASTVYTTQGKLFRMAQDDTDSTASSQ